MAETATFSMFHRKAPPPAPPELMPDPGPDLESEALSPLRALLRAEPPPPAAPTPPPALAPDAGGVAPAERDDARASRREARRLVRQAIGSGLPSSWPPDPPVPTQGSVPAPAPWEDAGKQAQPAGKQDQPPARSLGGLEAPAHAYTLSLAMPYQLLGLADPLVCSLTSTVAAGAPLQLSARRSGMYRPGCPPAQPRFSYDAVPDTRTGLLAGSRVLTARGEVAVERLTPGDAVLTLRGPALLPVTWIGCSAASEPPVEIAAGAFGPDRPRQALRVAAGHPVFLEADPVAAGSLVNGTTIRSLDLRDAPLFHVGVGAAEVLLAEGVLLASAVR